MKSLVGLTAGVLLFRLFMLPAQAAFTSLYGFGDGVCTTTDNDQLPALYYGHRYTNGRIWIEVLAERQGLTYDTNKNLSYYGHYSAALVTNLNNFNAGDASTALFVVWVNDADFVDFMTLDPYTTNNIAVWTNGINQSLSNHLTAIQTLYTKGARTLVMPNAVDMAKVPQYNGLEPIERSFVRDRVVDFNARFALMVSNAMVSLPGLTIYQPNLFALLDDILAQPANYGVTNALYDGRTVDALSDPNVYDYSLNGPGAVYIFWDPTDPTAKVHAVIGDFVQQLISPPQIDKITVVGGSNRLDVANVPVGRDGCVVGSTNLVNWTIDVNCDSTNVTQSIFVPSSGTKRFYRLSFPPFTWSWP